MSSRNDVFERDAVADVRAFALQRTFRALLDATARPGEIAQLPSKREGDEEALRATGLCGIARDVADALLDAETTFAIAGGKHAAAEAALGRATHAKAAASNSCAFAFVPQNVRGEEASAFALSLCPGTLADPHKGATLVVECATLVGCDKDGRRVGSASGAESATTWELTGPGIAKVARIECDRDDILRARQARRDEFPCGIDIVLVDRAGHLAAIPRSTTCKEGKSWAM